MSLAISKVEGGQLNAMVKNLMRLTGIKDAKEAVRQFNADLWTLTKVAQAVGDAIMRTVNVLAGQTSDQAVDSTGYKRGFIDATVLAEMPRGKVGKRKLFLVPLELDGVHPYLIEGLLAEKGMVTADPFASLAFVAQNKDLCSDKAVATQWKNKLDQFCYAACDRWAVEGRVDVGRDGNLWSGVWWFVCSRK